MSGKYALIIGNSRYDDSSLSRLKAPDMDVQGLERVLKAPAVGQFDEVTTLLNEGCASVRRAIARFYDQRKRNDLLLLYFSGHGVKDEQGNLYLALRDTESGLLAGTALETAFITARMDRSFSKRLVLVLDCCHSGAFAHGSKAAQGVSVGTAEAFEGTGQGRVILTATDSTQYAWEGDQIIGEAQSSLFTHFLIDGLETGAADQDGDGIVTIDELYDYVHEQVVNTTPRQTPHKWAYRQEGEIVLAQNPFVKRSALPPEVEEARNSKLSSLRLEAVQQLKRLLRGHHVGRAAAALAALNELALDDSRKVASAAEEALKVHGEDEQPQPIVVADATHPGGDRGARAADHSEPSSSDIFISYAHEDHEKARALAAVLGARGWKVWWDRKIAPGEAFDVVIERELGSCKCAIVLWSARSVGATWVRNEARRAARRQVLVPILIDQVETPLEFDNLQTADLTAWTVAAELPELESVLDRILALSPIPNEQHARSAVDDARREFRAGQRATALAALERFRPAHDLVSRTLAELRAEAERIEREQAEARRRESEAAQLAAEKARIEREQAEASRREAEAVQVAAEKARSEREQAEARRREAEAAQLAAEQARVERERVAAETAERQRALVAEQARIASEAEDAAHAKAERARQRDFEADRIRSEEPQAARSFAFIPEAIESERRDDPQSWWSTARLAQVAAAVVVVLVLGIGLVSLRSRRDVATRPPVSQRQAQPSEAAPAPAPAPGPPPKPRTPAVEPASVPTEVATLPSRPAPIEPVEPSPVGLSGVSAGKPSETVAVGQASAKRLEEIQGRARSLAQAGQRVDALNAAAEGLRINPADPMLRGVVDSLLRDAQSAAAREKQDANALDAPERAEAPFNDGLKYERDAVRLRRAGRLDGATRSYWSAAEAFRVAVEKSKRIAAEEAAAANHPPSEPPASVKKSEPVQTPPRPAMSLNERAAVETEFVNEALRRYEAAYASLNVDSVKAVYPAAPAGQLAKDFAASRSYKLKVQVDNYQFVFTDTLTAAVVSATVVHDAVSKSGERNQGEKGQKFQLEKQGQTWTIKQVR